VLDKRLFAAVHTANAERAFNGADGLGARGATATTNEGNRADRQGQGGDSAGGKSDESAIFGDLKIASTVLFVVAPSRNVPGPPTRRTGLQLGPVTGGDDRREGDCDGRREAGGEPGQEHNRPYL